MAPNPTGRSRLRERVAAIDAGRLVDPRIYSPAHYTHAGVETRQVASEYYWDGQKRGVDPLRPIFVFQYTLSGWGTYEALGRRERIGADRAFLAVLPSAHRYYLPAESAEWTFFWLIVRHPYVVNRMIELKRRHGAVFDLACGEAAAFRAVQLLEGVLQLRFRDSFAEEQALFEWMIEMERFAQHAAFPLRERERLLEEVREYIRARIERPVDVAELGRRLGMSRSHFGHHFKAVTGLSPAAYVRQIRLEEASHRLVHTDDPLSAVAAATGLAGANDLCKLFRHHFQITPGEFRKQMRGPGRG